MLLVTPTFVGDNAPRLSRSVSVSRDTDARRLFWAAVWLAVVLVSIKAYYLGVPGAFAVVQGEYLRSIAAISYADVIFAAILWVCARVILAVFQRWQWVGRLTSLTFLAFSAFCCVYAVANVVVFGVFGGFLTYPLLALVGNVRMLRSSVALHLTTPVTFALVCLPLAYIALVEVTIARLPAADRASWRRRAVALASLGVWTTFGQYTFATEWATRQHHQIAENSHWVLVSSWWEAVNGGTIVRMRETFSPADLDDFEPSGARPLPTPVKARSASAGLPGGRQAAALRPPNVILIVLESVAARWVGLNGSLYKTTPNLEAESKGSLVFENFYAHIGRSSDSLGAMLLSTYPKLGFRDLTEEYPRLPGTSLAALFRNRGYRTAFITPSDLSWAEWATFLGSRQFDDVHDYHQLPCSPPLSSWGVEDRCMMDAVIQFIEQDSTNPFFVMAWSQQTHHPYEPTPGIPLIDDLVTEPVPDAYNLGRYLNVLHEMDENLGRLFEAIRQAGLEKDTLVVITGDHGQAFGYPHDNYGQGREVYEEDVHVPLMLWYPRLYKSARRSATIGSHVDLAPTIADLTGLKVPPDWQGRSLFDTSRAPRAYFYVAEDRFSLGVREGNWKYIFDLREGTEQLYDLDRDPTEQQNLASQEPERCARLRQRLAAWTEANRRQYESISHQG